MSDLKVISVEEFEKIEKNKLGQLFYPTSDFSLIKEFGPNSIFGADSKFGPDSKFGIGCIFEDTYHAKTTRPFITLGGCGDIERTCYFFDFVEGIYVRAGCFFGTLEEFKTKVWTDEKTPETPSKKTKSYLAFCDLAEAEFK